MDIRNRGKRGNYKKIKRRAPADQTTKANKPMFGAWIHGLRCRWVDLDAFHGSEDKNKTLP